MGWRRWIPGPRAPWSGASPGWLASLSEAGPGCCLPRSLQVAASPPCPCLACKDRPVQSGAIDSFCHWTCDKSVSDCSIHVEIMTIAPRIEWVGRTFAEWRGEQFLPFISCKPCQAFSAHSEVSVKHSVTSLLEKTTFQGWFSFFSIFWFFFSLVLCWIATSFQFGIQEDQPQQIWQQKTLHNLQTASCWSA